MNALGTSGRFPSNLGQVDIATRTISSGPSRRRARSVILLLAASVGLMMTGFGIIFPVFARRLGEFGSGVEALGLMTLSFALAQLIAAPFMGSLADRFGRKPLVLVALAAFTLANIAFLLASSTAAFILIRAFEGALTAGLFPSAMGIVADVVPQKQRAQWVGIIMGSYGAGLVFGPVIGGFLYDRWGFTAPFVVSAIVALAALLAAFIMIPETRTAEVRWREKLRKRRAAAMSPGEGTSFWDSLPRPLYLFATLLILDFVVVFAFAFIEPQMVFYFYEELDWTTIQFGMIVSAYGLAMVFGQLVLGRSSDRLGRKPVIVLGSFLAVTFYAGLVFSTAYPFLLLVSAIAGLGEALILPALSSYYLDISDERYRSRVVGVKESAASFGGVAGPLLLVLVSPSLSAIVVFAISGLVVLTSAILAVVALPATDQVAKADSVQWEATEKRALAAQSALRGIVLRASAARTTNSSQSAGRSVVNLSEYRT